MDDFDSKLEVKRKLNEDPIESETKKMSYPSYIDRYFTKYYKLNVKYPNNDHLLLLHSNKVVICSLAPTHPILDKTKFKIEKIEFLQQINGEMSGKHKNNAKNLNVLQALCRITCLKLNKEPQVSVNFKIYSCMNAKLIEINEKLLTEPELLQNKPETHGFLAILFPKLDDINKQLSDLLTECEYLKEINKNN
jgi:hypothetical protein